VLPFITAKKINNVFLAGCNRYARMADSGNAWQREQQRQQRKTTAAAEKGGSGGNKCLLKCSTNFKKATFGILEF
jgi:hypothetical protein